MAGYGGGPGRVGSRDHHDTVAQKERERAGGSTEGQRRKWRKTGLGFRINQAPPICTQADGDWTHRPGVGGWRHAAYRCHVPKQWAQGAAHGGG